MCVCGVFLRIFDSEDHVATHRNSLTLFLSDMKYHLFPFSCVIELARISSTMLSRSGKRKYLCLFSDLRGKDSSLSSVNRRLNVVFLLN